MIMFWKVPMASQALFWFATAQANPWNLRKKRQQNIVTDGLKCAVLKQDPDQAFLGRTVKEKQKHSQTYANMLCNALF